MQGQHELPDDERREELEELLSRLKRARGALQEVNHENHAEFEVGLTESQNRIDGMIQEAEDELSDIPEWDRSLVQDLVLENADRRSTEHDRVDNEAVMRFEVGQMGNETKCRYAVAVGSGNEWFHIEDSDGDWDEVWSN